MNKKFEVKGLNNFDYGVEYKICRGDCWVPVIEFLDERKGQTLKEALKRLDEICKNK